MKDWYKVYDEAKSKMSEKIDIVNDSEVLACWLFDIPVKQKESTERVLELKDLINEKKKVLQTVEDQVSVQVFNEKDSKDKQKYTNQSIRDAEVRIRLSEHEVFKKLSAGLNELNQDLIKASGDSEYWGSMFSAVKNEVYHRRRVDELDAMKEIQSNKAKEIMTEE